MKRFLLFTILVLSSVYCFGQDAFVVTLQPVSSLVCNGKTVSLLISSTGNNTRVYQWQKFNTAFGGYFNVANGSGYTGALVTNTGTDAVEDAVTSFSINIAITGAAGAGTYRCMVKDGTGTTPPTIYSNVITVTIVSPPPTPTATNGSACGPSSTVVLSASGASGTQTYQWYFGGKPINGETNATYTTPSISVNTTYYVTIDNGTCESVQVPVVAQIITPPAAPVPTNGSGCGPSAVVLNASGAANGQYRWYDLSAKPPIAGQTNSSFTTPVISATTTYNVSIFNGTCESTKVAIVAQINTVPTAPATTGNSSCGPSALLLTATGGTNGQYRWYNASTGGTAIAGQTSNTYTTPSLPATATYYVSIYNGTCESARSSVLAQINPLPAAPATTGSVSCTPAALTLNATGGTNGQYRWYTSATIKSPLTGQTNSSYTTTLLSASATYYVSVNNGTCEGARTPVTATISSIPAAPSVTDNSLCVAGSVALFASGAADGQYRWYDVSTGGQPVTGEVNSKYLTPSITATTVFYVAINNGNCESTRTPVTAIIGGTGCNNAPVIQSTAINTQIEGKVTLDLVSLISDADKNLDLNTLKIIVLPASGASASITAAHALILDYKNISFSGIENLTIEVCDLAGACTQKQLNIEVAGDIVVYNALSPGNDNKNDIFLLKYIDILSQKNHVSIYSRWGDLLFDVSDYDNVSKVFRGLNNSGNEIPSGTYFYKIELANGKEPKTGYLTLKRRE